MAFVDLRVFFFLAVVSVLETSARSCTVCVSIMGMTFSLFLVGQVMGMD